MYLWLCGCGRCRSLQEPHVVIGIRRGCHIIESEMEGKATELITMDWKGERVNWLSLRPDRYITGRGVHHHRLVRHRLLLRLHLLLLVLYLGDVGRSDRLNLSRDALGTGDITGSICGGCSRTRRGGRRDRNRAI